MKKLCPFAKGIITDVCDLKQIPNNSFDVAISSQVIEHVPDDSKMLKEVYRILNQAGTFTFQPLSRSDMFLDLLRQG